MVNVIKDERDWNISVTLDHRDCGYLFYPNSMHACEYNGRCVNGEYVECTLENCPIKTGE